MYSKLRRRGTFACVFIALMFISFCSASQAVTINGKSLGAISDVVKEATGSSFPEIPKHSLMLYERVRNGSQMRYQSYVMTVSADGSLAHRFNGIVEDDSSYLPVNSSTSVVEKMSLAISNKRFGDRYNVAYTTGQFNVDGGDYDGRYGYQTIDIKGAESTAQITSPSDNYWWRYGRQVWGVANLQVKGFEDKDIFVVAHTTKMANSTGDLKFFFFALDRNETGDISRTILNADGGDSDGYRVWGYSHGVLGCSIATGDIDGDGNKNDIALAWTRDGGSWLYVYSVTKSGNGVKVTQRREVLVHDGYSGDGMGYRQACPTAIVGDFDGDGEDEAAFAGRVYPWDGSQECNSFRIGILDYNYGSWRYEAESIPTQIGKGGAYAPTRATRCDFDGDGKDEFAVLLFPENSAGVTHPRLERWYCDENTIKPKRDTSHIKGGVGDTSVFGYAVNHTNTYYIIMEEFSIVAAPLTGTKGKAKLAEDIAISHVNSSRSSVFVIPTQLDSNGEFAGFGSTQRIFNYEDSSEGRRGALIAADFANETLRLADKPYHTINDCDRSYVTVLQALPYHVDTVKLDGGLENYMINYSFSGFEGDEGNGKMSVSYTDTNKQKSSRSVKFSAASTTETISELGDVGPYVQGYLKFRATQANIAGNFDERIKMAGQIYQGILDFVTTKINSTTEKASETATTKTESTKLTARVWDAYIAYEAQQHIWRYRILNNPLPSWYVLGPKADYSSRDIDPDSTNYFITFTLYDDPTKCDITEDANNIYQARHEEGNLFSYPATLSDIEGYSSEAELTGREWVTISKGSTFEKDIKFEQEKIDSIGYDEETKPSELTKTISGAKSMVNTVAGWLGFDKPFKEGEPIPDSSTNTETFSNSLSTSEEIFIELNARSTNPEGAGYRVMTMPFVAREGTVKVGHIVDLFSNETQRYLYPLWGNESRYRAYPDPSLVLPRKFYRNGANLTAQTNNAAAMLMRGLRFYATELDLYSDTNLLAGLTYEIRVPMYNASFVDTGTFKVKLSYADKNSQHQNHFDVKKPYETMNDDVLHEIQTINMSLGAWPSNKGWAIFTWKIPDDFPTGHYIFFVQVDPEHELNEVHESRFGSTETVLDFGANNEGYFDFLVTSQADFDSKVRTAAAIRSGAYKPEKSDGVIYSTFYAKGQDGGVKAAFDLDDRSGTIQADVKFMNYETDQENADFIVLLAFLAEMLDVSPDFTVQVNCTVTYDGDDYYPEVYLNGVNLKPGVLEEVAERGRPTRDDIESIFMTYRMALIPHTTITFPLNISPRAMIWENGPGFEFYIPELSAASVMAEIAESNNASDPSNDPSDNPNDDPNVDPETPTYSNPGNSSGGCSMGFGGLALMMLSGLILKTRKDD